ncbi:hypothetical protein BV378_04450 [Nostoc sp. RF31YmG]|nr:hypothetical protein BV378_04450 [Nostoc sp. RF31YmG]
MPKDIPDLFEVAIMKYLHQERCNFFVIIHPYGDRHFLLYSTSKSEWIFDPFVTHLNKFIAGIFKRKNFRIYVRGNRGTETSSSKFMQETP